MKLIRLVTMVVMIGALAACHSAKDVSSSTSKDRMPSGEQIEKQADKKALPAQRMPTGREVPAQAQKQLEEANQ